MWLAYQTHPIVTLVSSRLINRGDLKRLLKLDPAFGKVARNWGKSWVSFWEGTDKLRKRGGSVFGKLLINLDTVGSVVGKFPGPRFIQSSGLGFV